MELNSKFVRSIAVILCTAFSQPVYAQLGFSAIPGPPVGRAIGLTPEIRSILQEMVKTYQDAESYQDQGRVSLSRMTGRVQQITIMPTSISLRRPNFIQLIGGGQLISCDGATLVIALDGLGQYTATKAPAQLRMRDIEIGAPGGGLDEGYPEIAEFLCGEDVYSRWIRRIQRISLAKQRKIEDRLCHVVRYQSVYKADITLLIDVERHVLLRSEMDITQSQAPPNAPQVPPSQQDRVRIELDLTPVSIDHEIPDSEFAVSKPKGLARVSEFQAQDADQQQQQQQQQPPPPADLTEDVRNRFVGKQLPRIMGDDLVGKPIAPEFFQNHVTLLFLWAPLESDSLRAIQMVQRISEQFSQLDEFSVLSVCNGVDQPDLVRNLVVAKQATYRTMIDEDRQVMQAFAVEGLPLFFLVSPDQKIVNAWHGAPPERELQIVSKVKEQLAKSSK